MEAKGIRVLMIDDDKEDFETVRRLLNGVKYTRYEVEWAPDYDAGFEALRNGKHDLFLIDYRLGADSGIDLLREGVAAGCGRPMIILTGLGDHTVDMQVMEAGAADYISKDSLSAEILERTVRHALNQRDTMEHLRQAKNAAEEATHLKNNLVTLVSHDLRGPIAGLRSYLSLAKKESAGGSETTAFYLSAALEYVEKLQTLVDGLLKLERFKSGKVKLNSAPLPVHELLDGVIARMAPDVSRKRLSLSSDIPPGMVVFADKILLEEVLYNIISNAIKYCRPNGQIACFVPAGKPSTIAIQDNGVGMPEKRINEIFSFESKASSPGTTGEMGTGLGLPLSYEIMRLHGGEIAVESTPDKGSTFYVTLPPPVDASAD